MSETEEARGAAEESTDAVVSDSTEQASETSSKQGEGLKTVWLKRTRKFSLADY